MCTSVPEVCAGDVVSPLPRRGVEEAHVELLRYKRIAPRVIDRRRRIRTWRASAGTVALDALEESQALRLLSELLNVDTRELRGAALKLQGSNGVRELTAGESTAAHAAVTAMTLEAMDCAAVEQNVWWRWLWWCEDPEVNVFDVHVGAVDALRTSHTSVLEFLRDPTSLLVAAEALDVGADDALHDAVQSMHPETIAATARVVAVYDYVKTMVPPQSHLHDRLGRPLWRAGAFLSSVLRTRMLGRWVDRTPVSRPLAVSFRCGKGLCDSEYVISDT